MFSGPANAQKPHPLSYRPDLPTRSKVHFGWRNGKRVPVSYTWPITEQERALLDARPLTIRPASAKEN